MVSNGDTMKLESTKVITEFNIKFDKQELNDIVGNIGILTEDIDHDTMISKYAPLWDLRLFLGEVLDK